VKHSKGIVQGIAILAIAFIYSGCGVPGLLGNVIVGSGNLKTETRSVSSFSAVTLSGSGTLTIAVTGTESLTIEADDNILPVLTSEVSGNRLTLGVKPNTGIQPSKGVKYTLTVKNLDDVETSGSANVDARGLNTSRFRVLMSGSGSVVLAGKADSLELQLSGSARFSGEGLEAKTATIDSSGSSNVVVRVSDKLDVTVSGSGNILYIGNPTVSQHISGSGRITRQQQ
jgi:Putative auto-transporter adhesin, head GIN domain